MALGRFRLDRDIEMETFFKRFGPPANRRPEVCCCESKHHKSFVTVTKMVESYSARVIGNLLLGQFRDSSADLPV